MGTRLDDGYDGNDDERLYGVVIRARSSSYDRASKQGARSLFELDL